jgi:hypothetical protein
VGDLAQFMVANKLSEQAVRDQASTLSFPQSVIEYFQASRRENAIGLANNECFSGLPRNTPWRLSGATSFSSAEGTQTGERQGPIRRPPRG